MRRVMLCSSALTGSLLIGVNLASAADLFSPAPVASTPELALPAVSALNGKISVYGGYVDQDDQDGGTIGLEGSLSVPLGHAFGFQGDASAGALDGEFVGTIGGHLFWRDPASGLIGGYAAYEHNEAANSDRFRLAAEGQAYLGRLTLEGLVGWESLDNDFGGDEDELLALANVAYYPHDDLRVYGGYHRFAGLNLGAVGAEYQLSSSFVGNGTSVYVEGRIGDDDYAAVTGGLRLYFGAESKSLIRRHREDDPNFASINYLTFGASEECHRGYMIYEGRCVPMYDAVE